MPKREDYERKKGPERRTHNQPLGNVLGKIVCVVSVNSEGRNETPTHAAIRVDVDFLAIPVMVHVTSAEQMDDLIDCMISARNNVWPNN